MLMMMMMMMMVWQRVSVTRLVPSCVIIKLASVNVGRTSSDALVTNALLVPLSLSLSLSVCLSVCMYVCRFVSRNPYSLSSNESCP